LQERALVCLPQGTGVRTAFDTACAARGLRPRVALEASAPHVVAGLAIRGLGVAILSESMATAQEAALHSMTIVEPKLRSRLELVWKADAVASPATDALVAHAQQRFG